jgi:hypothetical protein
MQDIQVIGNERDDTETRIRRLSVFPKKNGARSLAQANEIEPNPKLLPNHRGRDNHLRNPLGGNIFISHGELENSLSTLVEDVYRTACEYAVIRDYDGVCS